jgi:hypothetical protein
MKDHIDDVRRFALLAGVAGALFSAPALAADRPNHAPCFSITQWRGWKAPNENTLYLGVNMHDVYRVDLSAGSPHLLWPNAHLTSRVQGLNSVCSAIDLQLDVSDTGGLGYREPLIARTLTKLTPEEIAAIPMKYRPN